MKFFLSLKHLILFIFVLTFSFSLYQYISNNNVKKSEPINEYLSEVIISPSHNKPLYVDFSYLDIDTDSEIILSSLKKNIEGLRKTLSNYLDPIKISKLNVNKGNNYIQLLLLTNESLSNVDIRTKFDLMTFMKSSLVPELAFYNENLMIEFDQEIKFIEESFILNNNTDGKKSIVKINKEKNIFIANLSNFNDEIFFNIANKFINFSNIRIEDKIITFTKPDIVELQDLISIQIYPDIQKSSYEPIIYNKIYILMTLVSFFSLLILIILNFNLRKIINYLKLS